MNAISVNGIAPWFRLTPRERSYANYLKVGLIERQGCNFATQYEYNDTTVSADVWTESRKVGTFTVLVEKTCGDCQSPRPPPEVLDRYSPSNQEAAFPFRGMRPLFQLRQAYFTFSRTGLSDRRPARSFSVRTEIPKASIPPEGISSVKFNTTVFVSPGSRSK